MEYRINKIEVELRNHINDATSEHKVHTKQGISINKDKNEHQRKDPKEFNTDKNPERKDLSSSTEESDKKDVIAEPQKGHFIDIRK